MPHTILKSWNGGHLGRHLEFLKMLNDAQLASFRFFNNNTFPNRIPKKQQLYNSMPGHC